MKSVFILYYQGFPETPTPWRIAETILTSDGPRTRLCEGVWKDKEVALARLLELEEKANKSV